MTTDTTALQERIARALFLSERWNWYDHRPDREKTPEGDREQREKMAALWDAEAGKPWHESRWPSFRQEYPRLAAAVLPIVEAAVKRGQAEALRDAADSVHDNAASPYCLPCHRDDADLLHTIAAQIEQETPDEQ